MLVHSIPQPIEANCEYLMQPLKHNNVIPQIRGKKLTFIDSKDFERLWFLFSSSNFSNAFLAHATIRYDLMTADKIFKSISCHLFCIDHKILLETDINEQFDIWLKIIQ